MLKMKNKFLSIFLVLVMVFGLSTPIFAASNNRYINGNPEKITIDFTQRSGSTYIVKITNNREKPITNWQLSFKTNFKLSNPQDLNFSVLKDNTYIFTPKSQNIIDVGKSFEFTVNSNKKQNSEIHNVDFKYEEVDDIYKIDADKDNLPDYIEKMLGTNTSSTDTDNDGLIDGFEFSYLKTSLLMIDTDNNGITDANEDFDKDGLTNIEEQKLGTLPNNIDTDGDGLTDFDEVNIYKTNPLNKDSDNDGLSDDEELKLGLNPNNPKSDGITPDSERTFNQTVDNLIKDDTLLNSDSWLQPTISGTVSGDISKNVRLEKSSNNAFDENRSVLSDVIDVYTSYKTPLTLSFSYTQNYKGNINNLTIVSVSENGFDIIDTTIDTTNKKLSGEITGEGTYFVIDLDEFLKGVGINVFANINKPTSTLSLSESENDYIYDNNGNIIQTIDRKKALKNEVSNNPSSFSFASTASTISTASAATGKADIVFVIDKTGSMGSSISNVKNNVTTFAQKLTDDYNIDANFSLVEFQDITCDGTSSTMLHKNLSSNWFTNVTAFTNEVNTLYPDGGGDTPETPIDGLEMARQLDWRSDAAKFVVLVTDADYKNNNNFGISNMQEMASMFLNNGIIVSAISYDASIYSTLTNTTGGLYGYIYGNFSDVLLGLAEKIGEVTNSGGEWAFLDDYQAVKLKDTLANASTNDTDSDGLTDAQELNISVERDMMPYISKLLNKRSVPVEYYTGKTTLTVWKYLSNPVLLDTDYDGIPDGNTDYDGKTVTCDPSPRSNSFVGKLHWTEDANAKESKQNIEFVVDYRSLFESNVDYKKDLAVLTSLYAADIYDNSYLTVTGGATGGSDAPTALEGLFGLKDLEDIHINGADYGVDVDDSTEFVIGHRRVTYNGSTREIIVVVVRGTNGTNAEWSSNFDVGANTAEYYAATGSNHPDWVNKDNHKGFDVAANRILDKINNYLSRHSLTSGPRAILITGHSRGAAIANLIGAHYEKDLSFMSYTYTFAAPNSTTDINAESFKTIFNVVNKDDIIPYLPLSNWGFKKYGIIKDISVEDHYENKWGTAQKGTWEWLTGVDYNNDGGTQRTLDAFANIASNRSQLYVLDSSPDGRVWENNLGHTTLEGAESELTELTNTLRNEKLLKFCRLSIVGGGFLTPYHVEVNYSPAYLMQMLANMTTGVGPMLGHDTKGKYAAAKASFVASSGKVVVGGMTHPHLPITYYLIVYNNFVDHV